jgi:anti-sigma B factor antagonist
MREGILSDELAGKNTMEELSIAVTPNIEGVVAIKAIGTVDSLTTPALQKHFKSVIDKGQYVIVLDLSEVQFISSSGLGLLLGTVETLRSNGGDLVLMQVPQEILYVLEIMSVDDYFKMINSLEELTNHSN